MIKKYLDFLNESSEKSGIIYKYGCVLSYFKIDNWNDIISQIDLNDLSRIY